MGFLFAHLQARFLRRTSKGIDRKKCQVRTSAVERGDLLDALIYGDIFDCAVTLEELWRYAPIRIERDELYRRLRDDPVLRRIVVERNGFYCLHDRTALLDKRPPRIARARRLQQRARFVGRALRHVPFVRGLILTGSTSADDATKTADVDLLVIVAAGRMGTVFLLLGSLSRLVGRRLFCPNWYMSEDSLAMAPASLYIARELMQARGLTGKADALLARNPWIPERFPNVPAHPGVDRSLKGSTRLQRFLENRLRGVVGDRIELWARGLAAARLRAHYGEFALEVPTETMARFEAGVALGFHGYRYEHTTLKAYAARRALLQERLARAGGEEPHANSPRRTFAGAREISESGD
jgi:hypothetical protein